MVSGKGQNRVPRACGYPPCEMCGSGDIWGSGSLLVTAVTADARVVPAGGGAPLIVGVQVQNSNL